MYGFLGLKNIFYAQCEYRKTIVVKTMFVRFFGERQFGGAASQVPRGTCLVFAVHLLERR